MSKKDKSKFRKRIKAQILKEISQTPTSQKNIPPFQTTTVSAKTPSISPENPPASIKDDALNYTKKDLKKSAIIIGSMIIFIVALTIVDNKTGILLKAGNQIFRVLHIGS